MMRRSFIRVVTIAALLVACTASDVPTDPAWGKEPCAHCAMVLSQRRFGAQVVTKGGDHFFFDDPGCMVVFLEERRLADARPWVYDEAARRWRDARESRYASSGATPMDFGFEATPVGAVAWSEMRDRVLEKARAAR